MTCGVHHCLVLGCRHLGYLESEVIHRMLKSKVLGLNNVEINYKHFIGLKF